MIESSLSALKGAFNSEVRIKRKIESNMKQTSRALSESSELIRDDLQDHPSVHTFQRVQGR